MFKPAPSEIQDVMLSKRYVFVGPELPYYLNIIAIRANNPETEDTLAVLCYDEEGRPVNRYFPAFTNRLRDKPVEGEACLSNGQYFNVFALGEHAGKEALVETHSMGFDTKLKKKLRHISKNLHAVIADAKDVSPKDTISQKIKAGFEKFMALCEQHRKFHGNFFSYTLLSETDF